ncbi:hypothetical protein ND748_10330 [Frankia sp. AiPs1]|uniref:hypothetical protein n=1 Tax=Frankia sp. AiPs1 TaxID=573493 RepID=UPI002042D6D3|nr:hypothetical protein [Frankia sp. AiPs1]MCM3922053.1 hypothetical protein [Frankia sp. AiPs1]
MAPEIVGGRPGTARRIDAPPSTPLDLGPDEAYEIGVSLRARDSFRFHHGGSDEAAEAQIRSMLEEFLVRSARTVSARGFVRLARDGYSVVLTPEGTAVTEYSTVHRERTWAQVRAGVPSRFRRRRSGRGYLRDAAGDPPAPGAPVARLDVPSAIDPATVYLSSRARTSFDRILHLHGATDEELDDEIRMRLASLPAGTVGLARERPGVEIVVDGLRWLVSDDARVIVGVARATSSAAVADAEPAGQVSRS